MPENNNVNVGARIAVFVALVIAFTLGTQFDHFFRTQTKETRHTKIRPRAQPPHAQSLPRHKYLHSLMRLTNWNCEPKSKLLQAFPNAVMIDVGAYDSSEWEDYKQAARKVYSFEPSPRLAAGLINAANEPKYRDFINFTHAAVTNKTGTVKFHQFKGGSMQDAVHKQPFADDQNTIVVDVPAIRLDDLDIKEHVNLLKVDTQGHELMVLQGAKRLLTAPNPIDLLHLELSPLLMESHGYHGSEMFEFLYSIGYTCFDCATWTQPPLNGPRDFKGFVDTVNVPLMFEGKPHGGWTDVVCVI